MTGGLGVSREGSASPYSEVHIYLYGKEYPRALTRKSLAGWYHRALWLPPEDTRPGSVAGVGD